MVNIVIRGRIPSKKNSKRIVVVRGKPLILPSTEHKKWHYDASKQLIPYWNEFVNTTPLPLKRATINMRFFAPDARSADMTNKAESVMDLLVDNGFVEDDNWFICGMLVLSFGGIARDNPRVEIDIIPLI